MANSRVALFGGSFNPPHLGHQMAALWVLETQAVDALWFVPCFMHPFEKELEPFDLRLGMCEAAARALGPRVEVSAIERELGGPSRTFETVEALRKKYPQHEFRVVIGSDLLEELDTWYRAAELKAQVPFLVVPRAGAAGESEFAIPAVSSTEVRRRLGAGLSVAALVPRAVLAFIEARGLYRRTDAS